MAINVYYMYYVCINVCNMKILLIMMKEIMIMKINNESNIIIIIKIIEVKEISNEKKIMA